MFGFFMKYRTEANALLKVISYAVLKIISLVKEVIDYARQELDGTQFAF